MGVGGLTWSFLSLLLTQAAEGRQKAQEGEEHAQEGPRRDGSIGVAFVYIRNLAVFRTVSYLHLS